MTVCFAVVVSASGLTDYMGATGFIVDRLHLQPELVSLGVAQLLGGQDVVDGHTAVLQALYCTYASTHLHACNKRAL